MEFIKQHKNIFIWAGILALVVAGYLLLRNRDVNEGSSLEIVDSFSPASFSQGAAAGQQIISILNELRQLRIDKGVFESPVFKSLVDYTVATTSELLGRPDPFAPLPFELKITE